MSFSDSSNFWCAHTS
uniref:Uncharacterized protein n=1 Tax=Rhizophora mucronata TaxID=61149 RepID=A0A2P2P984_RHIMU